MLCDFVTRPLVYEVSKLEDTFPCGTTKVTLKQDHYNSSVDNKELKICNYYKSPILPDEPNEEHFSLSFSGVTPVLRIGGSSREITTTPVIDKTIIWSYTFDGKENLTKNDLSNDFVIEEFNDKVIISATKNFDNLGKVIKIIATLPRYSCAIELEVKR